MFEKFQDYMFYLLYGPLKRISKAKNQFYLLFKVLGKVFDQIKEDIFRVREESMIISASERFLDEHGKDRDMRRLKGETVESYRTRLSMKKIIAELAGTSKGMILALKALGYDKSRIEPFYIHDQARWAEFTIYLSSRLESGVNDISVIDAEIMKIKPASAKPSYGVEEGTRIESRSQYEGKFSRYLLCNEIVCGQWPYLNNNVGYLLKSHTTSASEDEYKIVGYPTTAYVNASEEKYQEHRFVLLNKYDSDIKEESLVSGETFKYPRAGYTATSEEKFKEIEGTILELNNTLIQEESGDVGKETDYPLCNTIKTKEV